MNKYIWPFCLLAIVAATLFPTSVLAASAAELDSAADKTLVTFREDVNGADVFLNQAAGYLVFPRVIKVGIGIGGETGEGVLRVPSWGTGSRNAPDRQGPNGRSPG